MDFPERLIEGYNTFLKERLPREQSRFHALANGQHPEIMVIGCCDSRVSPEVIFDSRPGELFVVRNVANIVPPYSPDDERRSVSAAIEFAVDGLRVKDVVVLGHARCGGVRAFGEQSEPLSPGDFIGKWMELMAPAAAKTPRREDSLADYLTRLELANIINSVNNLETFPRIAQLIKEGSLSLHGAYFGVASGALDVLDRVSGTFRRIAAEEHAKAFAGPHF